MHALEIRHTSRLTDSIELDFDLFAFHCSINCLVISSTTVDETLKCCNFAHAKFVQESFYKKRGGGCSSLIVHLIFLTRFVRVRSVRSNLSKSKKKSTRFFLLSMLEEILMFGFLNQVFSIACKNECL